MPTGELAVLFAYQSLSETTTAPRRTPISLKAASESAKDQRTARSRLRGLVVATSRAARSATARDAD
jgi:hypothetical protein